MSIKASIKRLSHEEKQTLGRFYLYDGVNELMSCVVLEPPFKDNKNNISSICSGVYRAKLRYSQKYAWHYHILDVEGRELILIHFGNYYRDTRGCLLLGNNFTDLDGDGFRDVTNSKKTMQKLLKLAPKEFTIIIDDFYLNT